MATHPSNSCLENSMDRGGWQATVNVVTKSQTRLKRLSMHTHAEVIKELCDTAIILYFPQRVHFAYYLLFNKC